MRIPFELAETLAVVVDEGTLDAAARRLHVTPSAVSQRIKALEEQLGRLVLVRSKPVRPTEAGMSVIRLARQTALLEHDALAELGAGDDETALTVVPLAVNADSLATWFLEPLARLAEQHPVVFDLHRDDLQNEWLSQQGVDPARPPRHYVPASSDFASAVRLGLGWAMLPRFQSHDALERGELVLLGGPPVDVALHWQQWNLRSPLLDAIADAIVAEGRRVLAIPPAR